MSVTLKPRRVTELPRKLIQAHPTRLLIANELRHKTLIIKQIETLDATKPRILIRIKEKIRYTNTPHRKQRKQ